MNRLSLAEEIIGLALRRGADMADVYIKDYKNLSVEVKQQDVESLDSSETIGIALRVIRQKRLGFSFTTDVDSIGKMVDDAVEASRWSGEDVYLDLPERSIASDIDIFDEKIADVSEGSAIENALMLEKSALSFDRRIKKVRKASAFFYCSFTSFANSKGVRAHYKGTIVSSHIMAIAEDKGDSQMAWDMGIARFLEAIDFSAIGKSAADNAVSLLGARRISAVKAPVILDPFVATEFLGILASSFNSDNIQKGKSMLKGKLGMDIMSPVITIVDNGQMQRGIGSTPVDDEGVPTMKKDVVAKGKLLCYLYNTYTARKDNTVSTGNAVRGDFKGIPSVGVTNLYIEKGDIDRGALVKLPGRAIYIMEAMGMHTINPISGDFSVGVTGLWMENGEVAYPVKEAVISGNILDLFRRVRAVGSDLRFYGRVGSPSLLIEDIDISG